MGSQDSLWKEYLTVLREEEVTSYHMVGQHAKGLGLMATCSRSTEVKVMGQREIPQNPKQT